MRINSERLREALRTVARIGATPEGGVSRLALSDADKAARDQFSAWLREAGLEVRVDDVGNVYGLRSGTDPTARPVVMGSHLDSVKNGGKYDGALGVMAALEVVRTLNDHSVRTRRPIVVVNWTNEEGARFQPALLGSGTVAGEFPLEYAYSRTDRQGLRVVDELRRIGYLGVREHRLGPFAAYFELHIEQGPVLEAEGFDLGVVGGIQGQVWLRVTVTGQADHAGPTPMSMRRDSLVAAARMVVGLRDLAWAIDPQTVITVGQIRVEPDIINVIPGRTVFSVDIRNPRDELVELGEAVARRLLEKIAREERVEIQMERIWRFHTTYFDPELIDRVARCAERRQLRYKHLMSGAGHDALYLTRLGPVVMLFVPTVAGKSHCPEEDAPWPAIVSATEVLLDAVLETAGIG